MRGMFTCGVIDVLMEHGITFDAAAGISAGAVFGCNFKSRQIRRPIRYNKQYCADPRYCSLRSLILTGDLYAADFCYRELPDELDVFNRQVFRENPMGFYVGATDIETGECVFRNCMNGSDADMTWFRASASMPLVSRPVAFEDQLLLDGGITNAVPYRYMEDLGYDRNVIVLTQPKGYRKQPASGIAFIRLAYHRYPQLVDAMAHRHEMYNRQMEEIDAREQAGSSLVIRPPEALGIGHTEKNPEELERVYRIGRTEAEKRLAEIKDYLTGSGSLDTGN